MIFLIPQDLSHNLRFMSRNNFVLSSLIIHTLSVSYTMSTIFVYWYLVTRILSCLLHLYRVCWSISGYLPAGDVSHSLSLRVQYCHQQWLQFHYNIIHNIMLFRCHL